MSNLKEGVAPNQFEDAREPLRQFYGEEAIFTGTVDHSRKIGQIVVASNVCDLSTNPLYREDTVSEDGFPQITVVPEHVAGHFNQKIGISVMSARSILRVAYSSMAQRIQPSTMVRLVELDKAVFSAPAFVGSKLEFDHSQPIPLGVGYLGATTVSVNEKSAASFMGMGITTSGVPSEPHMSQDKLVEAAGQLLGVVGLRDKPKGKQIVPILQAIGVSSFGIPPTENEELTLQIERMDTDERNLRGNVRILGRRNRVVAVIHDIQAALVPLPAALRIFKPR